MNGKDIVFTLLILLLLGFSGFVYTQNLALNNRVVELEKAGVAEAEEAEKAAPEPETTEDGETLPLGISREVAAYIDAELYDFSVSLAEGMVTRQLLVVNSNNRAQILLGTDNNGNAALRINRPSGEPSVLLGATHSSPAILIYNSEGELSLSFGEDASRNGQINLFNSFERPVISLRSGEYNDGVILLGNSNGRNVATLTTAEPGGDGELLLNRKDGAPFIQLNPTVNGHGQMRLFAKDGSVHSAVAASANGAGLWLLNNAEGQPRLDFSITPEGSGQIEISSEEGTEIVLPAADETL